MPRRKLSEYRAKHIICTALALSYHGWEIDADADVAAQLARLPLGQFVVKVDQAVKGRFKKGLVLLGVPRAQLSVAVARLRRHGYRWLLIEPMYVHEASAERYLSIASQRSGLVLTYSDRGGIDVESHGHNMRSVALGAHPHWSSLGAATGLSEEHLKTLVETFRRQHMAFLEVNPYILHDGTPVLLDLAVEVDDAGAFFVNTWTSDDFRFATLASQTPEERMVMQLDEKSPASFKLDIINPNGSIFLLLSGGGASIVVADEVHNLGYGDDLANYGEYSGNPTSEESFLYTDAVLSLLAASRAPRKVLFIGGAVANFTDIANTFGGIIQAIYKHAAELRQHHVKVFVRRGGPRQEIGLAKIREALERHGLLGAVYDPSRPLTEVVAEAVQEVARD